MAVKSRLFIVYHPDGYDGLYAMNVNEDFGCMGTDKEYADYYKTKKSAREDQQMLEEKHQIVTIVVKY